MVKKRIFPAGSHQDGLRREPGLAISGLCENLGSVRTWFQMFAAASHHFRNSRNAAPRWLKFDFSSAVNSANVF